jgi:integrase
MRGNSRFTVEHAIEHFLEQQAMANLYQNTAGVWLVRFRFGGRQYYRSLDTTDEKQANGAKAQVEETLGLLKRGRLALPPGAGADEAGLFIISGGKVAHRPTVTPTGKTLKEVTDAYFAELPEGAKAASSVYTEKIHVGHLLRILKGPTPLNQIGVSELQGYVTKRSRESGQRDRKVQPATIKKELMTFGQVWAFAQARKWVEGSLDKSEVRLPKPAEKPPFQTWKEIQKTIERGGLTDQEVEALWDCLFLNEKEVLELLGYVKKKAAYPFIYPMFAFAAFTGARRSEIIRSEISDFNFDGKHVVLREKKRKRAVRESYRQVQLNGHLEKTVRKWLASHPGGQLTICSKPDRPLTPKAAHHHFSKTLEGSKWSKVRGFHVLRHSFASICAMRGVAEGIIDAWLGHQTLEMRARYRHLFPEQTQAAMSNLFTPSGAPRSES